MNLVDASVSVTTWDVYDTYLSGSAAANDAKSDESLVKLGKTTALSGVDQKGSEESVQASTVTGMIRHVRNKAVKMYLSENLLF